jgi:hypothetical protein
VAFFYQLANGFHNAPSFIFHDETVRKRDKITGLGSGIIVATKVPFPHLFQSPQLTPIQGFAFNLLDGVTGLVYHPYLGAQKEGPKGFAKGIGKGVGGLVFKTTAAVVGLPAYSLKGLEKQIEKRHERTLKAQILEVRLRQAMVAFERATQEEKDAILARWNEMGGASRLASARGRAVGGPQKD